MLAAVVLMMDKEQRPAFQPCLGVLTWLSSQAKASGPHSFMFSSCLEILGGEVLLFVHLGQARSVTASRAQKLTCWLRFYAVGKVPG